MKVDKFTMSIEEDVPSVPFGRTNGPAVVVLSNFRRPVYHPAETDETRKIVKAFYNSRIQLKRKNRPPLSDEQLKKLKNQFEAASMFEKAKEMYADGYNPVYKAYHCGDPDKTEDGLYVKRSMRMKRFHIMFYDQKTDRFRIPDIQDNFQVSPFYGGVKAVLRKTRDKHFSKFVEWRRAMWNKLNRQLKSGEILHGDIKIGEAMYKPILSSKIDPGYVNDMLLVRERERIMHEHVVKPVPVTVDDLKRDKEYNYVEQYNKLFYELINGGKELPRSAFTEVINERFVRFERMSNMKPCTMISTECITPKINLFDVPDTRLDPFVFNGVNLPWA